MGAITSGNPQFLPDHNKNIGDPWQCAYSGCNIRGTLKQRSGIPFYRHDCYGHDPSVPKEFKETYYVCGVHHLAFTADGGEHPVSNSNRGYLAARSQATAGVQSW